MLGDALVSFLNLRSMKVEDRYVALRKPPDELADFSFITRPSGSSEISQEDYFPSFGDAVINKVTGIDLDWNGPFPDSSESSDMTSSITPTRGRSFVYATVVILLQDIPGKHIKLDLILGGHTNVDSQSIFTAPFDPLKTLPRRVIDKNLRSLNMRDIDTSLWSTAPGHDASFRNFLGKLVCEEVTFSPCRFHGTRLQNALYGFSAIKLCNCDDVRNLGIILHQHRETLYSIVLDNVRMSMCVDGINHWMQFFKALCMESSLQYVELSHLRIEKSNDVASHGRYDEDFDETRIRVIAWEGRELITMEAQTVVQVVNKLALRNVGVGLLFDVMDEQLVHVARL
jgi:hypothetical protein